MNPDNPAAAAAIRRPTRTSITNALRRLARPAGAFDAARYFRGEHGLRFHNVGTTAVRALARAIHAAHRATWTVDDAMGLADALIGDPYLETKAVGIEVLARYRQAFTPRLLPRWKSWLARGLSANWATTDHICGTLIGPLLVQHPRQIPRIRTWTSHRSMWVRRASAVSLIPAVRCGYALDTAYEVAKALHPDREDLVQKAVGWMLREAGTRDAARLERYLRDTGAAIPRTTVRYAIERFPARKRRILLAATRPGR
ncbi:MAG TPA: DNA alkylation repair protein [Vicinamibacterales bacterium]|nr:DNA alkylation repair protein [Vicinamibacterales bacterium]